ncbi:MAG: chromosomal replication initiator protein DnaA [Oscillospiraceae bacterium]|nr:chromosomal replication initiator protein DnaA [Oscillospiraceae bacterium]
MYSSAYIWGRVIAALEKQLTVPVVSSYLDDAEIMEVNESSIVLYTPSEYRKDMILGRFSLYIKEAMKDLFDWNVTLKVISEDEAAAYRDSRKETEPFMFNPQFTFDRFVVGSSNRFAHAAAVAVANNPAEAYNPLFIYGQSGLGKTHLLYAIAGEIHRQHPDCKIVYIKGDQFTNELIAAVQEGKNVEFRNKYRNADLFLVDDIQFIAGKQSTQEEFFHTFNSLYEAKKQIVLTSDRPPNEMQRLEDRLLTRFEWGLLADIQPPDYETRMAIIKNKAYSLGLQMPDDVCSYIADNITTNIRQIEGTVKKIMAYRDLTGHEIDLPSVSRAIKDMYKGKPEALPTPGLIIAEVSRFYSIEENVLRGTLKNKVTAEARQVAMYLIRKLTNLSLPDIGKEFGKDHTTVLHSTRKIENSIHETGSPIADNLRDITANINSKL